MAFVDSSGLVVRSTLALLGATAAVTISGCAAASTAPPDPALPPSLHVGEAHIDAAGAHLPGGLRLRLSAVGRPGAMSATSDAPPQQVGGDVTIERAGGVVEWWRDASGRLEHGVTLQRRPEGAGELELELEVGARAVRTTEDGAVELTAHDGTRARYGSLAVLDARGRAVPARLSPRGERLVIAIDDDEARYPLVVDPLFEVVSEGVLTRSSGCSSLGLGETLAMTPAGDVVALGAPGIPNCTVFSSNAGGVFLYGRSGTDWSPLAAMEDVTSANDQLGRSVALSDDGTRLAALSRIDARLVSRSGATLVVDQYLTPAPVDCRSITTNATGSRVVVGCPAAGPGSDGAVWMWEGSFGSYARTAVPIPAGSGWRAGSVVALDATGDRLLVTLPGSGSRGGIALVLRYAGAWTTEAMLEAPIVMDTLGLAAAFSRDGSRFIVSAGAPASRVVAFTYRRTGTSWAHDGTLTSTSLDTSEIGASVAMDASGTRAAVGAPGAGVVRLFTRTSGGAWREDDIDDAVTRPTARFGTAVALSMSGDRLAVGATGSTAGSGYVVRLTPGLDLGASCSRDSACLSDRCVDEVCCNRPCDLECESCRAVDTGLAEGTCGPVLAARRESCRPRAGDCNPEDFCTGGPTCPDDAPLASGATCRASAGDCDPAEVCDGVSNTCPGDVLEPPGSTCGDEDTDCSLPGTCDGVSPRCTGSAGERPFGYICGPADPFNPCDASDVCDGSGVCIEQSAPASMPCGLSSLAGACDAPDHCAGADVGAFCIPAVLTGVECRPQVGACDLAETCDGASVACPEDEMLAGGVVCRASIDASCDGEESCDGTSSACPADDNVCEPDAGGTDAGAPVLDTGMVMDAATPADAAVPPLAVATCGCRTARAEGGVAGLALSMLVLLGVRGRRQRR